MGRHVNGDTGVDAASGAERDDGLIELQAVISSDTHVGIDFDRIAAGTPDAAASPARPDALVEHGTVGDGHEME